MAKNELVVADSFQLATAYDGMNEELKAQMMDEMDDFEGGGDINLRKIKMPGSGGKAFEIEGDDPEDADVQKSFDAVILFSHYMNARWDVAYDGKENAPTCSSLDAKTGIEFETGEKIECDGCPYNVYGSAKEGKGKACKNMRRLYLMLSGKPYLYNFSVPPTSLKDVTKQLQRIMAVKKLPLSSLVCRFSLVTGTTGDRTISKVAVECVGKLPETIATSMKDARAGIKEQYKNVGITSEDYNTSSDGGFVSVGEGEGEENLPFN